MDLTNAFGPDRMTWFLGVLQGICSTLSMARLTASWFADLNIGSFMDRQVCALTFIGIRASHVRSELGRFMFTGSRMPRAVWRSLCSA